MGAAIRRHVHGAAAAPGSALVPSAGRRVSRRRTFKACERLVSSTHRIAHYAGLREAAQPLIEKRSFRPKRRRKGGRSAVEEPLASAGGGGGRFGVCALRAACARRKTRGFWPASAPVEMTGFFWGGLPVALTLRIKCSLLDGLHYRALVRSDAHGSSFRRDAETSTRDERAPRTFARTHSSDEG